MKSNLLKQLITSLANVTQTGGNIALVGAYFQRWIKYKII